MKERKSQRGEKTEEEGGKEQRREAKQQQYKKNIIWDSNINLIRF